MAWAVVLVVVLVVAWAAVLVVVVLAVAVAMAAKVEKVLVPLESFHEWLAALEEQATSEVQAASEVASEVQAQPPPRQS